MPKAWEVDTGAHLEKFTCALSVGKSFHQAVVSACLLLLNLGHLGLELSIFEAPG